MSAVPFRTGTPTLAINEFIVTTGTYPSTIDGDTLGVIYDFAGIFSEEIPEYGQLLDGQTLSISQDPALFSIVGPDYGGNGTSNFKLPNLQGVATIGAGGGYTIGTLTGNSDISLTPAELPAPLPGAQGQSFSNLQPSLPVTPIICVDGNAPATSGLAQSTFVGEIVNFAGSQIPTGWLAANGQVLSTTQDSALYQVIGSTYGGNGTTTFALPNLTGRVAVGAGSSLTLGAAYGETSTTLTDGNIPPGIIIGASSSGQAFNDDQPSLAVNYLICVDGDFPSSSVPLSSTTALVGQIVEFAGSVVPAGWALANGQLLSVHGSSQDLFAVVGLTYGGNGTTDFAVPNLNGRTIAGTESTYPFILGDTSGTDTVTLGTGNLPTQDQTPVPCFLPGTMILTPVGERPVETLKPGDRVVTQTGAARPIVWIGTGKTRATRGRRTAATPVTICKGAFAPNVPNRDLHVTKGHSFYLDKVLIPAEFLVNHRSILWDDRAQDITVFHIELDTHDILLANGAPAESYRDDGNRWLFANRNPAWDQPAPGPFAPVLTGGPIVDAVWRRILDRAGPRPGLPLTDDPDLHIAVEGTRIDPIGQAQALVRFSLPAAARDIRLISRAAVPQELGLARDPRSLGVAVQGVTVRKGTQFRAFSTEEPMFSEGFHDWEPATQIRWTDGRATLPPAILQGFEGSVEVVIARTGRAQYIAAA